MPAGSDWANSLPGTGSGVGREGLEIPRWLLRPPDGRTRSLRPEDVRGQRGISNPSRSSLGAPGGLMTADTIAAIATAPGEAGIGIVRASGPRALDCALA